MKINILLSAVILLLFSAVSASNDEHNHTGHSDDLLTLLQYKITIAKLQNGFEGLTAQEKIKSLKLQHKKINQALPVLQNYMAVPEGRYPNMDMYQQSLQSRAALLNEYAQLLSKLNALSQ